MVKHFGKPTLVIPSQPTIEWRRFQLRIEWSKNGFVAWLWDRELLPDNRTTMYGFSLLRSARYESRDEFTFGTVCGPISEGSGPKTRLRIPLAHRQHGY